MNSNDEAHQQHQQHQQQPQQQQQQYKNPSTSHHNHRRPYALAIFSVFVLSLYCFYYMESGIQLRQGYILDALNFTRDTLVGKFFHQATASNYSNLEYLIELPKCKIPNLDPFNAEIAHFYGPQQYHDCRDKPLLTYTSVLDNKAFLHVDTDHISKYTDNGVTCCYRAVKRVGAPKKADSAVKYSKCVSFGENTAISEDTVYVECKDDYTNKTVYKNVHATITVTKDVEKRLTPSSNESSHLSVLCIGIDSVSRLNFMRLMKETDSFVKTREWVELKGYNKIGDNTFPNLMAIFTGMDEDTAYRRCNPKSLGALDKCNMIFYKFRDAGYATAYAEDEASISTFNYHKKGFIKPPTDYYFRPYILATEDKLKTTRVDGMKYCTGPESAGERILDLAKTFASRFVGDPYFGFFWMNSFSHNMLNAISRMDEKVRSFLEDLDSSSVLNDTLVILFSDHGIRFGDILQTRTGWFEERLPIFFASFPTWFKENYPDKYSNFKINSERLTTPYDIYMTLQDVLVLSTESNYVPTPSTACRNCQSLFEQVSPDRSCEDVSIVRHWCTCADLQKVSTETNAMTEAAIYLLDQIWKIVEKHESQAKCAKYELDKILSASTSQSDFSYNNNSVGVYLLLFIRTKPRAIFSATLSFNRSNSSSTDSFKLEGPITRLDSYSAHSGCTHDSYLAKYCYCVF